jgi:hypothetical protein
MKYLPIILSLIFSIQAFSQGQELMLLSGSDTSFYSFHQQRLAVLKKKDLKEHSKDFIFRSWDPLSVLTIQKIDDVISAEILFQVFEVVEDNSPVKTFSKTYSIPTDSASKLYEIIINSRIQDFPSSKFIPNWEHGLDGVTYILETKTDSTFSFKSYWTPSSQQSVFEAVAIIKFRQNINSISNMDNFREIFFKDNPFSAFTYYGVSYSVIAIKTKRSTKKKNKR